VRQRWWLFLVVAVLVAACAGSTNASPSPSAAVPSATSSVAPNGSSAPFAGKPYTLTLPDGWQIFDLSNPAGKAAIDAYVKVNPAFATAIQSFLAMPNVLLAVNTLLGDAVVILPIGSQGLSLSEIGESITAQFAAVPGLASVPPAEPMTLPGGDAVHWDLSLTVNKPGGGTVTPEESVYLFVKGPTAAMVEFVSPGGGSDPEESTIVQSFQFQP